MRSKTIGSEGFVYYIIYAIDPNSVILKKEWVLEIIKKKFY